MIPVLTTCGWISSFRRCIGLIYNKMGLTIFSVGVQMGWMNECTRQFKIKLKIKIKLKLKAYETE